MDGLDVLGCENPDYVGFDYMSLLKGSGGLLSSFGGGGGDDKKGPSAEQIKQQMELQQAQQSAATMKMALIGVAAVVGLGGFALLLRK